MNRNVKLSISGLHRDAGGEDAGVATCYDAEYFKRNNSHYLLYEEPQEGFEENSKVRIKIKDDLMELTKQGVIRTLMVFERNKKHTIGYATPYGEMQLGIATKEINIEESEQVIKVCVEYTLEADGEHLSDCRIQLRIEE